MDVSEHTPKQRLVEDRLGVPITDWVDAARAEGTAKTWIDLASALSAAANERVSHETLRTWYQRATRTAEKEAVPT